MGFTDRYKDYRPKKPKIFEAMFNGECAECGWEIEAGDDVGYFEDSLMHESCIDEVIATDT